LFSILKSKINPSTDESNDLTNWSDAKELDHLHKLTTLQSHLIELRRFVADRFSKTDLPAFHLLNEHFYDLFDNIGESFIAFLLVFPELCFNGFALN
jgi:hypothetical protein